MSLKAQVEAIIYAAEEPVTLKQLAALLKDAVVADLRAQEQARLALNEIVSDDPPEEETGDDTTPFLDEPSDPSANGVVAQAAVEAAAAEGAVTPEARQADPGPATQEELTAEKEQLKAVNARLSALVEELIADYASADHGMEIRHIAGGYRLATKPEHHDVVVSFAKSLKPPVRLSLQALETLAVIAYKQPVTVPEISEIRGVDSAGVIATLLDRKLITTAGRKQVIGRPILYKTTKEFLLRFGLNDISELPSVEEFEKLGEPQAELFNPAPQATTSDQSVPATDAAPAEQVMPQHEPHATEEEPQASPDKP